MKKKKIVFLGLAAALVVGGLVGWKVLTGKSGKQGDNVVYVNTVEKLMDLGGANGTVNRFSGVVESQETWSVAQNQEKTVKEVFVQVGQEVSKGTALFSYDTEKFQSDLAQAQLDLERLQNEINSMQTAIQDLEKEKKKADANNQATYTLQIQDQQLQVKQKEFEVQSKQLEIDKLKENIDNATVSSEIDGVVKSINTGTDTGTSGSSDSSFLTIMKTGDLKIKGSINEQNIGSLVEEQAVLVHSRVDDSQTWKGKVTKIDRENATSQSSNYYYYSGDSSNSSSSYPFYVELESSQGLMLGQHVYIEPDYGQSESKDREGVWLDSYMIDRTGDTPFVWADNGKGRLEKRTVTLGEYDEELDQYQISSGLTKEDAITFPEEGLKEGMETAISQEGMLGQSNPAGAEGSESDGVTEGTESPELYETLGEAEDSGSGQLSEDQELSGGDGSQEGAESGDQEGTQSQEGAESGTQEGTQRQEGAKSGGQEGVQSQEGAESRGDAQ